MAQVGKLFGKLLTQILVVIGYGTIGAEKSVTVWMSGKDTF
jgi:hypothetical protein